MLAAHPPCFQATTLVHAYTRDAATQLGGTITVGSHTYFSEGATGLAMLLQALTEKEEVETFVRGAQTTLGKAATSIKEIGSARAAAKALVAALPHIMECRRRVDDKNRLLKAMASAGNLPSAGQTVDMTQVDNAWDSFTSQLQQHDSHLDEQKNQLQGQLTRQVTRLSLLATPVACASNHPKRSLV